MSELRPSGCDELCHLLVGLCFHSILWLIPGEGAQGEGRGEREQGGQAACMDTCAAGNSPHARRACFISDMHACSAHVTRVFLSHLTVLPLTYSMFPPTCETQVFSHVMCMVPYMCATCFLPRVTRVSRGTCPRERMPCGGGSIASLFPSVSREVWLSLWFLTVLLLSHDYHLRFIK